MNATRTSLRSCRRLTDFLLLGTLCLSVTNPLPTAKADVATPTTTKITFLSGGKLIEGEIKIKVSCSGWPCTPGENCDTEGAPENASVAGEVFAFSATCKGSPCDIKEPFYLNQLKLDACDMSGEVNGKPFEIQNYSRTPVDFKKCTTDAQGHRNCELAVAIPE